MDLNEIDQWSREILQKEARKRGVRTPEMYSRGQLVRLILRHEYRSTLNVREAARLVGGIWGSAKVALRAGLGLAEARLEREFGRAREPAYVPPPRLEVPPGGREREVEVPAAAREVEIAHVSPVEPSAAAPSDTVAVAVAVAVDVDDHVNVNDHVNDHVDDAPAVLSGPQPSAAEPGEIEQLSYGPYRDSGLVLRWSVGDAAIHRARAVLGAQGELALRVISVRVEDGLYVRTETLDHGPIDSSGDFTAPLAPNAARYVSSVGLRSGHRFVSIVHAAR